VRSQALSGFTHNPTGLPVRSQGCNYNPTRLPVRSQGCTRTQTPNHNAPNNFSPPSRVLYFYTTYLTRDSTAQRVCSPGAGFNPPEFLSPCGLPLSCCLATPVVRSRGPGISLFARPQTVHTSTCQNLWPRINSNK